jgi:hypothetical protein
MPNLASAFLLALALTADLSVAACTRDELTAVASTFLQAAIEKRPFKTAPTVKVSQDAKIVGSLDDTAFGNITSNLRPNFKLQAVDTETCQVSTLVVVDEGKGPVPTAKEPAGASILSYRIALSGPGGLPTELELLNTNKLQKPTFFQPLSYPDTTPALWDTPSPGSFNRSGLLAVTSSYTDGIEKACGKCVLSTPTCARVENGWKIPVVCNAQFEMMGFPVYARRWVVDTQTGVVQGTYYYAGAKAMGGLFTHEFFAVKDGYIQQVQANWQTVKWRQPDVWGGKSPPENWKGPQDDAN